MSDVLLFDLETSGLLPLEDRITCISAKVFGKSEVVSFSGDFEAKILGDFSEFVSKHNVTRLVAYNGWSFDVPFLRVRAMANRVRIPSVFWREGNLTDPFHVLARSKKGKQVEFAALVGVGTDLLFGDGKKCLDWFAKGDFERIERHCESDIVALDAIYSRMFECGFV